MPHRLLFTGLYEIREFKTHRAVNLVAGGLQLGVYMNVQPGANFAVYDSANTANGFPAGTLRPNLVGGPRLSSGSNVVDFSVAKVFRVTERFKTEFRGSFFNVGNFANFDIPGHTLGNADFGIISSARPARTVQLALRLIF